MVGRARPGSQVPTVTAQQDINAPQDQVYALAKDIEGLAPFLPDVEEIKILSREGSVTRSRFVGRIKEFNRTIRWTEADHWDDDAQRCTFRQTEGDFSAYAGVWEFLSIPAGTSARLTIDYEYRVPLIGPLIQKLVRKKMQENCEQMLLALKARAEGSR